LGRQKHFRCLARKIGMSIVSFNEEGTTAWAGR